MTFYKIFFTKTFYASGLLGAASTFVLLKPSREELKYRFNNLILDVEFQNKYVRNKNNVHVEIDYSSAESKSLARKEFMGDPFSKVKLNKEFTNVLNDIRDKLK
eukprot:g185.t1